MLSIPSDVWEIRQPKLHSPGNSSIELDVEHCLVSHASQLSTDLFAPRQPVQNSCLWRSKFDFRGNANGSLLIEQADKPGGFL